MLVPSFVSRGMNAAGLRPDGGVRSRTNTWITSRRAIRDAVRTSPRLSYSQFAEDAIIQTLLPTGPGTYVDIGAGHPTRGSNTYALHLQGWRGLLVDPLRSNIELAVKVRPRDTALAALCGRIDGATVEFFEYEPYEYSTVVPERVVELAGLGFEPISSYFLEVASLATLVSSLQVTGPTLLSIDVEGLEMDVLRGNDWSVFTPGVIVVEEWQTPIHETTPVFAFLVERGYELVAVSGMSSIYRRAIAP